MRAPSFELLRRHRFALVAAASAVALLVLLLSVHGRTRVNVTLAQPVGWPDELVGPTRVIAHRLSGERAGPPSPSTPQIRSFHGWASVERVEFEPGSPQWVALAKLFAGRKFMRSLEHEPPCDFTAQFGLEFIGEQGQRGAVFSFPCSQVEGDTRMKTFDADALGEFAHGLFPADRRYPAADAGT